MDKRIAPSNLNLVIKMQFGSQVYGTQLPTSDTDIKAVYLPEPEAILLQRVTDNFSLSTKADPSQSNSPEDTDTEIFSLQRFLQLLLEGQTIALDMLFTPPSFYLMTPHPAWEALRSERSTFLHRGVTAMARYCQSQAMKYGLKGSRIAALREVLTFLETLPSKDRLREHDGVVREFVAAKRLLDSEVPIHVVTVEETHRPHAGWYLEVCDRKVPFDALVGFAKKIFQRSLDDYGQRALMAEKNQGVDWKALMHALRVTAEARELLLTGSITFPRPEAPLLLRVRQGQMPYAEVADQIEAGLKALDLAKLQSSLPEKPNHQAADQFVVRHYQKVVQDLQRGAK